MTSKHQIQTLKQAVHLISTGKSRELSRAAAALLGQPVGGWPETQQAREHLLNELPIRQYRDYTIDQFVAAVYTVDATDHYRAAQR